MRRTASLNEPRGGASAGEDRAPEPATAPDAVLAEARRLAEEAGPDAALPGLLARIEEAPGGAPVRLLAAELLARSGRADEGEALLRAGLAETPGDRDLAAAYARTAQARGDKTEAAARWLAYRERFADDPLGYEMAGGLLLELGRTDDAEQVLTEGSWLQQPGSEVLRNHARAAQQRADWPEALRRWDTFREQYPHDPGGYSGASFARHQLALEQVRQADALMEEALRLFPSNGDIIGTYARLAQTRRAWLDALDRWQLCRQRLPDDPVGYSGAGEAYRVLGRFDDAEAVLVEGTRKSPAHPGILGTLARVAHDRHDWPAALDRWTAYLRLFPDDSIAQSQLQLVLGELNRFEEAAALSAEPTTPRSEDGLAPAQLMLKFESLGQNCEFGVVQRHFGAEPLGLLRFSSTPHERLAAALNDGLAGVGEPENTTLAVQAGEYVTSDKRYHMLMHTFIRANDSDPQKRFDSFCRRLRYLRDKLLEDLAEARKIFVYSCEEPAPDEAIQALHASLCRSAQNRLLFVQSAEPRFAAGSFRQLDDGLMVGYVDRLSIDNPSFSSWLELCRAAFDRYPD
jgi:tetratricopeptide (TPR) repeat protein